MISIGPGAQSQLGLGRDLNLALGLILFGPGAHITLGCGQIVFPYTQDHKFFSVSKLINLDGFFTIS